MNSLIHHLRWGSIRVIVRSLLSLGLSFPISSKNKIEQFKPSPSYFSSFIAANARNWEVKINLKLIYAQNLPGANISPGLMYSTYGSLLPITATPCAFKGRHQFFPASMFALFGIFRILPLFSFSLSDISFGRSLLLLHRSTTNNIFGKGSYLKEDNRTYDQKFVYCSYRFFKL